MATNALVSSSGIDQFMVSQTSLNMAADAFDSDDKEFVNAKAYLQTASKLTGQNAYDHIADVIMRVLDEHPNDIYDIWEDLCVEQKKSKFQSAEDTILDKPEESTEVTLAQIQQKLFTKGEGEEEAADEGEEGDETPLPNMLELCFNFEQAGVGLNREETVRIFLALKQLSATGPLEHIRFWGKIFGTEQNYIVAEVEFPEGEGEDEEEEEEEEEEVPAADEEEGELVDTPPQPKWKKPPLPPKEPSKTGANRKTYFVCNEAGQPWTKLPNVTPIQISCSRKIKKFFTGKLEAPIISYPPFPGNESNYLRAQIARISAGTHISPAGFYHFDEEGGEEEEGTIRTNFIQDLEWEPIPTRDLVDPALTNWVHHVLHILPQGRTEWWNPKQPNEDEEEEEEEDEEREEPEEAVPEEGPPLLTPLSEDAQINELPAWTTRLSSKLVPQYAVAVVDSCLWPGAHAFCHGKTFENIYIGWGHKYQADNYSPMPPPPVMEEYPSGPEITESEDPTPQQEAELKAMIAAAEEEEEEEDEGTEDEKD